MTKRTALLLTCTLLLGSTGCSMFGGPEPEDAFNAFADALHRKDSGAAAKDTTDAVGFQFSGKQGVGEKVHAQAVIRMKRGTAKTCQT